MRDVMEQTNPARPFWLRVLQHPLVRLALLGSIFFVLDGISNGFMVLFCATPVKALGVAAAMAMLGLAIYWTFVRLIEKRPVSELSSSSFSREISAGVSVGTGLCVLCFVI